MKGYLIDKDIELKDLPSKLVTCDAPVIEEGSTEVLVDVYSAALNFFDILQVQGKYQVKKPFPYVPGAEIAGVISKDSPIPEGCDFIPGKTRVFGAANGSYAEQVTAEYYQLQVIPDGISFEEASGLFVTWPTSYAALKLRANVKEGAYLNSAAFVLGTERELKISASLLRRMGTCPRRCRWRGALCDSNCQGHGCKGRCNCWY